MKTTMVNHFIPTKKAKCTASIIPELPTHIIVEILSRLPIKTIFECQLVCKDWLSLTSSDPHFAHLHLSRSPISLLIKPIYRGGRESSQLRVVDLRNINHTEPRESQFKFTTKINIPFIGQNLTNSCNGLLCLPCFFKVYVCNPILGEYITLPYSKSGHSSEGSEIAIGFSHKTGQYKVIRFFRVLNRVGVDPFTGLNTYGDESEAEIYTIGSGVWRNLGRVPFRLTNRSSNSFVNGTLHWLNFEASSPDFLRCFDFEIEEFRVVPEPPEFGLKKVFPNCVSVGVLRDCLSVCDFSSPLPVDIWIMKDNGNKESWRKEYVIRDAIGKRGCLDHCEPIMILENGEILMLVNKDALVQYNPKLGRFKTLRIYGIRSKFDAIAHIPSFVSLQDVAKGESFSFVY